MRVSVQVQALVLQAIIQDMGIVLTTSHIKAYLLMTFKGLEYLHSHWILHRVE